MRESESDDDPQGGYVVRPDWSRPKVDSFFHWVEVEGVSMKRRSVDFEAVTLIQTLTLTLTLILTLILTPNLTLCIMLLRLLSGAHNR